MRSRYETPAERRAEPIGSQDHDDDAWVLLAETRFVRVYGRLRAATLGNVLNDRERVAGKPRACEEEVK